MRGYFCLIKLNEINYETKGSWLMARDHGWKLTPKVVLQTGLGPEGATGPPKKNVKTIQIFKEIAQFESILDLSYPPKNFISGRACLQGW